MSRAPRTPPVLLHALVRGPQRLHHLFHDVEVIEVELLGELKGAAIVFYDIEEVVVLIAYGELEQQGGELIDVGLDELIVAHGQGERITHEHAMDGA